MASAVCSVDLRKYKYVLESCLCMNVTGGVCESGECKHCGERDVETYDGFCRSCKRKGTVVFSKRDGGYQCSLCSVSGTQTQLNVSDRNQHLIEEHNVEPNNTQSIIREYESLFAVEIRGDEQQSLTAFTG